MSFSYADQFVGLKIYSKFAPNIVLQLVLMDGVHSDVMKL